MLCFPQTKLEESGRGIQTRSNLLFQPQYRSASHLGGAHAAKGAAYASNLSSQPLVFAAYLNL